MAAGFDGVDDVLQLANESTLRYPYTQPFSGHAWIRKQSAAGFCIMGKAQNSPPGAQQRGWAFNTENIGGQTGISFHLVNNGSSAHAFFQGTTTNNGNAAFMLNGLWFPVGFTYDGSGTIAGITLYLGGVDVVDGGGSADTLGGGTINVDGTPLRIGGFDTEFWTGDVCNIVLVPGELTATEMAALADIRNRDVNPATFLTTAAPDVWLPLRKSGASIDLTDYSGNGHHASVSTGAPAAVADPTVVLDWVGGKSFTGDDSSTYTPNGHLEAVLVGIVQDASSADRMAGVTHGGVSMTRVATHGLAQDTTGEPGAAYAYLLTSGVLQGAQTVAYDVSTGTDAKRSYIIGLNSIAPVQVVAGGRVQADADDPSVTLATTADFVGFIANFLYSGLNDPASITAPSGGAAFPPTDFGSQSAIAFMGNREGASIASGWVTTGSDDVAMIALALTAYRSSTPDIRRRRRTRTLTRL